MLRHLALWWRRGALPASPLSAPRGRTAAGARIAARVAALAEEGVPPAEIARRTGVARDAVALVLHLRSAGGPEISTGLGTLCRAGTGADARPAAA